MNSLRFNRSSQQAFRKPLDFLSNLSRSAVHLPQDSSHKRPDGYRKRRNNSASSLDDTDHSDIENYAQMEPRKSHSTQNSQSELQPPVPLIDIGSRSTSPYPRSRSAVQSEDEDDDYGIASSVRPLVGHGSGRGGNTARGIFSQGGLGHFLFGTWIGWQVWVGLLVFWHRFPFPLTGTYIQLILTHIMLIGFSTFTRALDRPFRWLGLGPAVAPSFPVAPQGGAYRGGNKKHILRSIGRWLSHGSGGIAGGGLFEFDVVVAKQVLPLAAVFVVKVILSNFSFAYAPLPTYQLARIGITPLAIIFACILQKENITGSTLSAALVATLNLLFATIRSNVRVTWESIVAGVFSSMFVALYPILLLRTYRTLVAGLVPQGDVLTGYPAPAEDAGNREETRAYYRTLHYASLLSLMILTPIVLLFGDVGNIYHNIPFLDVPFFWAMMIFGGMGSWAVFSSTLLMVKATSPLTTTFIAVPRTAFQLAVINLLRIPAPSWVGVILCWISSVWFLVARRDEGRSKNRLRLEGR
ncbi:hypothetical protein EK21DRAFT_83478 [Setomelanomma holmii]|uniref:GDP-mannose transporter n=1 Tax=Setomelanomma holmii TaxID=210430 RepID=A0A9P4HP46_9PLEO|nr:hypothetical protein EK21DRAFT_83478 [Setomelanomma holmii]